MGAWPSCGRPPPRRLILGSVIIDADLASTMGVEPGLVSTSKEKNMALCAAWRLVFMKHMHDEYATSVSLKKYAHSVK